VCNQCLPGIHSTKIKVKLLSHTIEFTNQRICSLFSNFEQMDISKLFTENLV
jgi:hypothetical protein